MKGLVGKGCGLYLQMLKTIDNSVVKPTPSFTKLVVAKN
tara:strand:+ start:232 stop:348 length:117 start_codon:yes stop_codon:yes gene_type:complete